MNNDNEDFQFPENEESSCEHCKLKFDRVHQLIHDFIEFNNNENSTVDDLAILFADFYDTSYEDGEKEAYDNIGSFAYDMAHGHSEDDEE